MYMPAPALPSSREPSVYAIREVVVSMVRRRARCSIVARSLGTGEMVMCAGEVAGGAWVAPSCSIVVLRLIQVLRQAIILIKVVGHGLVFDSGSSHTLPLNSSSGTVAPFTGKDAGSCWMSG